MKTTKYDSDDDLIKKEMQELQKPQDEYQVFGDFVASELRALQSDVNKRKLKRMIQKAIIDVGTLDENERCQSVQFINSEASTSSSQPTSPYYEYNSQVISPQQQYFSQEGGKFIGIIYFSLTL